MKNTLFFFKKKNIFFSVERKKNYFLISKSFRNLNKKTNLILIFIYKLNYSFKSKTCLSSGFKFIFSNSLKRTKLLKIVFLAFISFFKCFSFL